MRNRLCTYGAIAVAGACLTLALAATGADATTLPPGFQESTAFSGLNEPIAIEFAPNGRVFVAEKSGIIRTYSSLADSTPTQFADLRTKVHNYWDRGLMSIAVDPNFPTDPWLYVYYVHDAPIGGTAPTWGNAGQTSDDCPTPPGGTADGCVVSGRISRLQVSGEVMTGGEHVLVEDWCQQYPSHAGGGLEFGADGNLYFSGGEGASFGFADYGQDGDPVNPCGDPPGGVGEVNGQMEPPTAEGGRLRAQDLRTTSDPLGLSGAVIRIDPDTGAGVAGNPMFSSTNANQRRMLAYGLRNPFRLAVRPGAGDVWIGDPGTGAWEEIDRVSSPFAAVPNFGWPCYEGGINSSGNPASLRYSSMDQLDLDLCESLYAEGSASPPYWAYRHDREIVTGEACDETAGSAVSGLAFAPLSGGSFPASYAGALFFADHSRQCIWAIPADANGLPDPANVQAFAQQASFPVDLEIGPNGDLFYADIGTNTIRRIAFTGSPGNTPPTAAATAAPTSGDVPLTVDFDGTASSDPDAGDTLTYAWDLDGDGQLDDSTDSSPSFTYTTAGVYTVTLRVTDPSGALDEDTVTITAGSGPPAPSIDTPVAGTTWRVGQNIPFTGSATDPDDGALPAAALDWTLILNHCTTPGNCHQHTIQSYEDLASGSFTAPDHEYPSDLELQLTATDSDGNRSTVSRRLDPQTVVLTAASDPPAMNVSIGLANGAAPVSTQVIVGSSNTITTPDVQVKDHTTYHFSSWSDGQPRTHNVVAPASNTTYTARFASQAPGTSTLVFNPSADAYVHEGSPNTNFGSETFLRTDNAVNPGVESYLRFAIDGLAGKVQTAKLRLFSTSYTADGPAVSPTAPTWEESTVTWSNKPPPTGASLADSGEITTGTWVEWDVTPAVTGEGNTSFRLATDVSDGVNFHSRESATVTRRPELVLTVLNDAYPRPKGATPTYVSLVPAYDECTSPNRTHGPPLDDASCNPPVQSSAQLTVGSFDANQASASSTGFARFKVLVGAPDPAVDEADVALTVSITDVRNTVGLTDYTGELQLRTGIRLTDRDSGAAADDAATLGDIEVPVTVPCAATDTGAGATCGVSTTFDAVTPGMVDEGARAIWQLEQVELLDGGPDGDVDTPTGNAVFAHQGVFVP
jgi:glucose/arabinose dehydrogenase/PKD repeat protein